MKRTITMVIVLFFWFDHAGYSQCSQSFESDGTLVVSGVENGADHYYRNLIIQDLALASQQAFSEISLTLDYKVLYTIDTCRKNGTEIKILPLELTCQQVKYRKYDVSKALMPEKAGLVFNLVNDHGMLIDSLMVHDIPVNAESALYTALSAGEEHSVDFTVELSGVRFYFTKISYERFRDMILEIDAYYAAALLADSALTWAGSGFLSENAPGHELLLRQLELQRIIQYVNPSSFKEILEQNTGDVENITGKFNDLRKAARRLNAIISYNQIPSAFPAGKSGAVKLFIDGLEYYYRFAGRADFHYTDFLRKLALPEFRNGRLIFVYQLFSEQFGMSPKTGQSAAYQLAWDLQQMGSQYESAGDYLRALNYFELADKLAKRVYLPGAGAHARSAIVRMKDSLAYAYLNISARSAMASNPSMAATYFYKAKEIYQNQESSFEPAWLREHRIWLSGDFESQAERFVNEKNYGKAMAYLVEIQNFCRQESDYNCPEMLRTWVQLTRQGLYLEILNKAKSLADRDEFTEAGELYRQAVSMRQGNGYAIGKDIIETNLELRFRQVRFDELYEEGLRFYRLGDFVAALYYFNKAGNLSRMGLLKQEPGLMDIRLEAGRQVIMQNLSEGRVKAWANDFDGALFICDHLENLISEYDLPSNDSLLVQYENLKAEIKKKKCAKIQADYDKLMVEIQDASKMGEYIRAYDLAAEAVELSMGNLDCGIHDSEAWYQKVVLETPADYQRKERALNALAAKSWNLYLEGFDDLRKYHQKHKLLNQGIAFSPLIKRVMQFSDTAFLSGMLSYFIRVKNYDHALLVLHKLHDLGMQAESVAADQKALGRYYAENDAATITDEKAWDLLNNYAKKDKWYHDFRKSYKTTYMKAVNWKFRYWPFLWKK